MNEQVSWLLASPRMRKSQIHEFPVFPSFQFLILKIHFLVYWHDRLWVINIALDELVQEK